METTIMYWGNTGNPGNNGKQNGNYYLRCRVYRVWGLGFRVCDLGFWV